MKIRRRPTGKKTNGNTLAFDCVISANPALSTVFMAEQDILDKITGELPIQSISYRQYIDMLFSNTFEISELAKKDMSMFICKRLFYLYMEKELLTKITETPVNLENLTLEKFNAQILEYLSAPISAIKNYIWQYGGLDTMTDWNKLLMQLDPASVYCGLENDKVSLPVTTAKQTDLAIRVTWEEENNFNWGK